MTPSDDEDVPKSLLRAIAAMPTNKPVALLIRHAHRLAIPEGEAGDEFPITETGRRVSRKLGAELGTRLVSLRSSPLLRCTQTAELTAQGAGVQLPVRTDVMLGDPGVLVVDAEIARANWQRLGNSGVMSRLQTTAAAMPGMLSGQEGARLLLEHARGVVGSVPGVHLFVSHDVMIAAAAAHLAAEGGVGDPYPAFLEGCVLPV